MVEIRQIYEAQVEEQEQAEEEQENQIAMPLEFQEETPQEQEERLKQYQNKTFDFFIRKIKARLRDDWDLVIGITGPEGSSKSTLALKMGFAIDKNFDIENNVSYLPDAAEIFEKLNSISQFGVYVIDEAVRVLHKHHWFDNLQQKINEWYATERYQNKCTILCIPRFKNLTENFRNHRVNIWIHILARGVAVVYLKDLDKDVDDPWHIKFNQKRKMKYSQSRRVADITIWDQLRLERRTKNYLFDFAFDDLPEFERDIYRGLKEKSREKLKYEVGIEPKTSKKEGGESLEGS